MATTTDGFVSLAGEGKAYQAMGTTTTLKARAADTGGAYEAIEGVFPPRGGVPPHSHNQLDETLYVASGELTAQVGGRSIAAPAGTLIFVPRGTVHSFTNASDGPCTTLLWMIPQYGAGIEGFLEELDALPPGPPDMEKLGAIMVRYDTFPAQ